MAWFSDFEVGMYKFSLARFAVLPAVVLMAFLGGCGEGAAPTTETAPAVASTKPVPEEAPVAVVEGASGEETYKKFCWSCHAAGVAGAPKLGVAEDWGPRIALGLDALVANTITGVAPGMPARGLCMNCTDDELRDAVAWMIAQ